MWGHIGTCTTDVELFVISTMMENDTVQANNKQIMLTQTEISTVVCDRFQNKLRSITADTTANFLRTVRIYTFVFSLITFIMVNSPKGC